MWADDLILMTAHEDVATAKDRMERMQRVLLADASEKHSSYNPTKTRVIVMDGSAPTAQEIENERKLGSGEPPVDPEHRWPLGTQVSKLTLLGTVLDKTLSWDAHFAHRVNEAADGEYHVRQLAQHKSRLIDVMGYNSSV